MPDTEWLIYWLFDDRCSDYKKHGLIGATKASRLHFRLHQHRNNKRFPKNFEYRIVFRGSQESTLALEAKLRPKPNIGWNIGIGGFADGRGIRGISKSLEHRAKLRAAALSRYEDPEEKKRTSRSVKKALKNVDRSGANNPSFGKPMSEATKEKIRQRIAEHGGRKGSKNPNFKG